MGVKFLGSIHTYDLLGVNYCMDYSLNNGLHCTKQAHLLSELLPELKRSMMGAVPIFRDCVD